MTPKAIKLPGGARVAIAHIVNYGPANPDHWPAVLKLPDSIFEVHKPKQ